MLLFKTVIAALLHVTALVHAADTAAWKSRSIYFVLTDRVARSSSDTGGAACSNLGKYCGGTFKGLESKLDYIKGLGFDAIWITPVITSTYRSFISSSRFAHLCQIAQTDTMGTGHRTCTALTPTMVLQPI